MRALGIMVAVALLSPREADAGKCSGTPLGSVVMSPRDAEEVPSGSGIVVALLPKFDNNGLDGGGDNGWNRKWRFFDGKDHHKPAIVALAPGLFSYQPPQGTSGRLLLVADDGKTRLAAATFTATAAPLAAAPVVVSIKVVTAAKTRWGAITKLVATLKGKQPENAVALVVLGVTKTGSVVRSWGTVGDRNAHRVAGRSGSCEEIISDEIWSEAGDKVALAWVDAHGRLSKQSRTLTVQRGK